MPSGVFYPQVLVIPSIREDLTKIISTVDLVAHWKLEDVNDSWFNGLTLTNNSAVSFKRGFFGDCAKGNGSTSYLSRATTSLLNPSISNFCIIARFRGIKSSGTVTILQKHSGTNGYKIEYNGTSGIITVTLDDGTTTKTAISTTDAFDGQWHTLIVDVNRSANLKLYLDGSTAQATTSLATLVNSITNSTAFTLLASATPSQFSDMELDEVRLYFKTLSATDIETMMDIKQMHIIGTEERGASLTLNSSEERANFKMAFNGKDKKLKRRYTFGGNLIVIHHRIPMSGIRSMWNFQNTLDDESLLYNDLTKVAGTTAYITDGGISLDGSTYYSTTDNDSQNLPTFTIFGRISLPATVGGDGAKTLLIKGLESESPFYIRVNPHATAPNQLAVFVRNSGGVGTAVTYTYTSNTKFYFAVSYDGTNLKLYINGALTSTVARAGPLVKTYSALYIGADSAGSQIAKSSSKIYHMHITKDVLTAVQILDLSALTVPSLACLFDGVIIAKPELRDSTIPFSIETRDFLLDRLANDDLTAQFAGEHFMGEIMRIAVSRSSLVDYYDTTNVLDTTKKSSGKYFIREQLLNVFKWITDSADTVFYAKRRGYSRYLFHELDMSTHSGLSLAQSNLILPYNIEPEIRSSSNIIQVEGGILKTVEEQQTFDNATTKPSNTLYYAIKSTPEFILYGQFEVMVAKVGTPQDIHITLVQDKAGSPAGPEAETLASVTIPKELIPAAKAYVPISFDAKLDTSKMYWIMIDILGDGSNKYNFSDNGGASDTNMKTSSDGTTWTSVGYTFVYKFSHNEKVVSTAKKSDSVLKIGIRKLTFTDNTITDKATAQQIARGLIAKLGDDLVHFSNVKLKSIDIIPMPKMAISMLDSGADVNADYKVQSITMNFTPGKAGIIDRFIIEFGDQLVTAGQLFQQYVAQMRNSLQAEQPPITDTMSFGESQGVGVFITAVLVSPTRASQNIGILITVNTLQLPKTDMLWDTDDIGGYDVDNKWGYGVIDADNL